MIQVWDICSARKRLGLSQEQLAEVLGVSRNTIGRWERGECTPNDDKLTELELMLAKLEAPTVSADTPAPEHTTAPKDAEVSPPVVPARPRRWPVALICAGVVCALLIGIAALIGVYSIKRQLDPDNIIPAERIEGEEMEGSFTIESGTLHPIQP